VQPTTASSDDQSLVQGPGRCSLPRQALRCREASRRRCPGHLRGRVEVRRLHWVICFGVVFIRCRVVTTAAKNTQPSLNGRET
jgi:hypothetical protein